MDSQATLKWLSLLLGVGYLLQDIVLMVVFGGAPWWLFIENILLGLAYLAWGFFRCGKYPEVPLVWVAGWNAARVIDAALDFSRPLYFTVSHAVLVVLAVLVGVLAWLSLRQSKEKV